MPLKNLLVHLDQSGQSSAPLTGIFALINPILPSTVPQDVIAHLRQALVRTNTPWQPDHNLSKTT